MEGDDGRSCGASQSLLKYSWGEIITRIMAEGENGFQRHFREHWSGLSDREGKGQGGVRGLFSTRGGCVDILLAETQNRRAGAGRVGEPGVSVWCVENEASGVRGSGSDSRCLSLYVLLSRVYMF